MLTPEQDAALDAAAKAELWRRGHLAWKLHPPQRLVYDAVRSSTALKFYIDCARKFGKSYALGLIGLEDCIRIPQARVYFCAPHGTDAEDIVTDVCEQILADCPDALRPEYLRADRRYVFKNGSEFIIKGVNSEGAKFRRGPRATRFLGDEVATWDDLLFVINSIALPMTLTERGKAPADHGAMIVGASTPPRSPAHEAADMREDAIVEGAYAKFTIHDNPLVTPELRETYCKASGGAASTTWRREYLCEWVTDANTAVVPEFDAECEAEIVKEWPRPPFFDAYVSLDPGMKDKSGGLFAYWDFKAQKLVIEDEFLLPKANTQTLAFHVSSKEAELGWKAWMRVIDDSGLRVSADLTALGLRFLPAYKPNRDAAVANMRTMIGARDVIIHPRCKQLRRQLREAVWNKSGKDLDRSKDEGDVEDSPKGHFDLVAALWYLCRTVVKTRNPFPPGWQLQANTNAAPFRRRPPELPTLSSRLNQLAYGTTPAGRRVLRKGRGE